jgi:hypothetical protein
MTQFQPCVQNGTHDAEVQAESASVPSAVAGVPAVLIGDSLVSSYSFEALSAAIDAALAGAPLPTALVPTAPPAPVVPSGSSLALPSGSPLPSPGGNP